MRRRNLLSVKGFLVIVTAAIVLLTVIRVLSSFAGKSETIESTSDIVNFLAGFGWEVNPEPTNVKTIEIPKEFSDVYNKYNELQKIEGYDLSLYKGETAEHYTFEVLNYKGMTGVFANVIVAKGRIIGGDLCSYALDGFMTGFSGE